MKTAETKKEQLQPVFSITRSYSEKLNRGKFQTSDFFASRNYAWFYEPSKEEIEMKSLELFSACYHEVKSAIQNEIQSLTPEHEKVVVENKQGERVPDWKLRQAKCFPKPCKMGASCENHSFEAKAEGEWFKEEIQEENGKRLQQDTEALMEFEKVK